jgi:hypothetical protein
MKFHFKDTETSDSTSHFESSSSCNRMSYDEAIELIREKRPKINPNKGFVKILKEFETELSNEESPSSGHKKTCNEGPFKISPCFLKDRKSYGRPFKLSI